MGMSAWTADATWDKKGRDQGETRHRIRHIALDKQSPKLRWLHRPTPVTVKCWEAKPLVLVWRDFTTSSSDTANKLDKIGSPSGGLLLEKFNWHPVAPIQELWWASLLLVFMVWFNHIFALL
ncbi:MAG: hypothetical protein JKY96_03005 [Phycisphaerales bacterium]|nr:hypothetical protein [Phycisphaerales bacterium]